MPAFIIICLVPLLIWSNPSIVAEDGSTVAISEEEDHYHDPTLRWFVRHQRNGMWDADGYGVNCQDGPKCEPGVTPKGGDWASGVLA